MSDNSPCFPLPSRTFHQPTFHHPNGNLRPIRTASLDGGHHAQAVQRSIMRERISIADVPKVTGKRKPGYDSDDSMSDNKSPPSSPKFMHSYDMERDYATVKRTKMSNEREFPLSKLLATLDKPQLLSLINNLIDSNPNLQSEIASNIPRPTIHSVTNVLSSMEKKYQDSFPYTKWGQIKDDYSFNRVKPAIMELKGAILDYAAHFTSTEEFPTTTFSFLHLATSITQRLPDWDNHLHNEIKRDLYIKLAEYWTKAIVDAASKVSEGKIYGQAAVSEWAKNLAQHNRESNGMFEHAINEFIDKLGWIAGIQVGSNPALMSNHSYSFSGNNGHHHSVLPV
ncbi:Cut8 six-helix bundle-domain-containing protein [Glomus cerebriforme]|uniref:Tethering factor for nuclear proteasome STS1 n=1 Tax=Glomus cerebriforme TaxID=658196 RepID=A0A397SH82_9GLOM|nr:Cut8 six-helix bundle-domain-containing protein [Glomus cerebriforme]